MKTSISDRLKRGYGADQIGGLHEFPASDVTYVGDRLLRFRLQSPREPSQYQRFFLTQDASANDVHPAAPNRDAVDHNLASRARQLDAGLAEIGDFSLADGTKITSRQDLLAFNLDHFYRPTYLYTNGQTIASLVQRNHSRFELAYHPSLSDFTSFTNDYAQHVLIAPENLHVASSLELAERVAHELLSSVKPYSLRAQNGLQFAELVLQPAGSVPDSHGYTVHTLIATFRDESFHVRMGGPLRSQTEPYRVLNELRPQGFVLMVCATCEHFRFSGMTRDMSAGSSGYCRCCSGKGSECEPDMVSVRHWCPEYSFVADEKRSRPYINQLS